MMHSWVTKRPWLKTWKQTINFWGFDVWVLVTRERNKLVSYNKMLGRDTWMWTCWIVPVIQICTRVHSYSSLKFWVSTREFPDSSCQPCLQTTIKNQGIKWFGCICFLSKLNDLTALFTNKAYLIFATNNHIMKRKRHKQKHEHEFDQSRGKREQCWNFVISQLREKWKGSSSVTTPPMWKDCLEQKRETDQGFRCIIRGMYGFQGYCTAGTLVEMWVEGRQFRRLT